MDIEELKEKMRGLPLKTAGDISSQYPAIEGNEDGCRFRVTKEAITLSLGGCGIVNAVPAFVALLTGPKGSREATLRRLQLILEKPWVVRDVSDPPDATLILWDAQALG